MIGRLPGKLGSMTLPIQPPLSPMLAKLSTDIPTGDGWLYEPKWDGFRCIVFRDGDNIELASRNERPFTRYFPELLEPLLASLPKRCVVDGEIVVPATDDRGLDFDALLQRIHPAESRVRRLAAETPASFVAFDLLALNDDSLLDRPLAERHQLLSEQFAKVDAPIYLCPHTIDAAVAQRWFIEFEGAGLDGVVAKRLTDPYTPDKRTLIKVKHQRTADCVIAGYRVHKDGNGVGSLLLGLYDDSGDLHHVGVVASFTVKRRAELLAELEPLTHNALEHHPWRDWAEFMIDAAANGQRMPGGMNRWNANKDMSWEPVRIERVAEVLYEGLLSGRFRHNARFKRWRPDKDPAECTYAQLETVAPAELREMFAS
jgi:ATP-dependent DNA ligase